jgi:hypothetical protein
MEQTDYINDIFYYPMEPPRLERQENYNANIEYYNIEYTQIRRFRFYSRNFNNRQVYNIHIHKKNIIQLLYPLD